MSAANPSEATRVNRALFEAADWLRAIIEDAENGAHDFTPEIVASLRACVSEGDAALAAVGYEHNYGN